MIWNTISFLEQIRLSTSTHHLCSISCELNFPEGLKRLQGNTNKQTIFHSWIALQLWKINYQKKGNTAVANRCSHSVLLTGHIVIMNQNHTESSIDFLIILSLSQFDQFFCLQKVNTKKLDEITLVISNNSCSSEVRYAFSCKYNCPNLPINYVSFHMSSVFP